MDKSDITPALASRLIAAQFPQWADLPIMPVGLDGWDNTTFRLGDEMSVRLPSGDQYALQVDKEQQWLPVLARRLPLAIPQPLAKGIPGGGYPWPWSVYGWLDGDVATIERIDDLSRFATDLGGFLAALYDVDPAAGPSPGKHNFYRGGPLATYDGEAREAIASLDGEIDTRAATEAWEAALAATGRGTPVWIHGDVSASNLLVVDGRLSAVIDFGCSGVGDPACDLTIAWTFFFADSRDAFRARLPLDHETWARGRGWALWKALITLVDAMNSDRDGTDPAARRMGWRLSARDLIAEVLAEHRLAANPWLDAASRGA